MNCGKKAEYEIQGSSRRPDDLTLACTEHVGQLLPDEVATVFPFEPADWPLSGADATCCFIEP
jgi:hypothetical protein